MHQRPLDQTTFATRSRWEVKSWRQYEGYQPTAHLPPSADGSHARARPPASFNFLPSLITGKPSVVAEVSISQQRMVLSVTDKSGLVKTYVWKVDRRRRYRHADRPGTRWLSIDHRSKTYDDGRCPSRSSSTALCGIQPTPSPPPAGLAWLRPPRQGQCRMFFDLVKTYGKSNTKIIVTE